jgi:signal transduction histidine kinase
VKFEVECSEALAFHSYPNLVEVILLNLIENALFFSSLKLAAQPEVLVKAEQKHNYVELTVYDNGIGIEKEIRDRVWDMFFIGNIASRGNGLGLYIVRKSVQALGGNIFIQSEKDAYTRVVVMIPVVNTLLVGPKESGVLAPGSESEVSRSFR